MKRTAPSNGDTSCEKSKKSDQTTTTTMIPYGREGRLSEMCLDPDTAHLTHGSYGATPSRILTAQRRYQSNIEWMPDVFFRQKLLDDYLERITRVADFLGGDEKNMVLVPNVTSAVNSVLKNLSLGAGDAILTYSYTYRAVYNTCQCVADKTGTSILCVDIPLSIDSQQQVLDLYKVMLDKHTNIKLVILDYISSATATLFPVFELVAECRRRGVLTLVDGAHSPGHVDVNLEQLQPDFYTGNFHKWVFTPRSCAVLWVAPQHHGTIKPLVTSARYKSADWRHDFCYCGTLDYTAMLCVKEGIQMYQDLGGRVVLSAYITSLLDSAVSLLVSMWGTDRYPIPADMEAPFMRSVRLPLLRNFPPEETKGSAFGDLNSLMFCLSNRFSVIVSLLVVEGVSFVRLCGQFYNTIDEYRKLGEAVLTLKGEETLQTS